MAGFSRAGAITHSLETKQYDSVDASLRGSFPKEASVTFRIRVPNDTQSAAMRICNDENGILTELPMAACSAHHFSITLPMATLVGEACGGLFFYSYRVTGRFGTFDILRDEAASLTFGDPDDTRFDFVLLIYSERETIPAWLYGGTMYQIFPDRFSQGSGEKSSAHKSVLVAERQGVLCRDREVFPQLMREKAQNNKNNLFYGGDLDGITEKLDYLASLGVTVLYLNPIFASPSNHRYNTSDYRKVDDLLGGEEALHRLIEAAHARGIALILDGVFNHTGNESVYFDTCGRGAVPGAAESKDSPYYPWYHFEQYPDHYESWWGIRTLPRVMSDEESYRRFLFDEDGVVRHYLKMGIDGWRLDVADELSDDFLAALKQAATAEKPDAIVIGEVWEDATTKCAYGHRRKYFWGNELDSVMNYPIRTAILEYLTRGDFMTMRRALLTIYGNYPPFAAHTLMNILGTHDTERALTALSGETDDEIPYVARAEHRMEEKLLRTALARLRLAVVIQMTLPGVPCIYYGDEAGMEGFGDPFCRRPYPWGAENESLVSLYRALGTLRRQERIFADGDFALIFIDADVLCFERRGAEETIVVFLNRGSDVYELYAAGDVTVLLGARTTAPMDFAIYRMKNEENYSFQKKMEQSDEI